ncbi:MAG: GNAT family N-acetyltransferase [Emcibacter sp.]|nr:GNAT family N-acetyltransferase [Emcibacter sp.]
MKFEHKWVQKTFEDIKGNDNLLLQINDLTSKMEVLNSNYILDWANMTRMGEERELLIFLLYSSDGSEIKGIAVFDYFKSTFDTRFGEFRVLSRKVTRANSMGAPIIKGTEEFIKLATLVLFQNIKERVDVIFLNSVPTDSGLFNILKDDGPMSLKGNFTVTSYGSEGKRCLVQLEGDFDLYMKSLKGKVRNEFKNRIKYMDSQPEGELYLRCFTTRSDIDDFLKDGRIISEKTYQWRILDAGLKYEDAIRKKLELAESLGNFRSYILYIKGEPVSFVLGYILNGFYVFDSIGYDPDYGKQNVGILIHILYIRDLCENSTGIKASDLLTGENLFKRRVSNFTTLEQDFNVFPRTFKAASIVYPHIMISKLSDGIRDVLDNWGIKDRIKKIMRGQG